MRFIKHIILLMIACMTLTSIQASATPRRRSINASKNTRSAKARRRVIRTTPSSHRARRRTINQSARRSTAVPTRQKIRTTQRRADRRVERRQTRRQERRQERRVKRRVKRRTERRVERRVARRATRRHFRRGTVRRSHHNYPAHRTYRPYVRVRRALPLYVSAPPSRVVIDPYIECHGRDDDHFFDTIYHDGGSYGINGDLTDEERRINRGIERGLITPSEARRLRDMLWEIYALEDQSTADGFLTEEEEADLYWAERDLNRAIRWETQDFEVW